MPATPLNTLLSWVVSRWKPTVPQIKAWLGSFWHKEEKIPISQIDGLQTLLLQFATIGQLNAAAGALQPIDGLCDGATHITFPQRTMVSTIELLSQYVGSAKIGSSLNGDDYGTVDYQPSVISVLIINRAFNPGEGFYIACTNPADYKIRKA